MKITSANAQMPRTMRSSIIRIYLFQITMKFRVSAKKEARPCKSPEHSMWPHRCYYYHVYNLLNIILERVTTFAKQVEGMQQ